MIENRQSACAVLRSTSGAETPAATEAFTSTATGIRNLARASQIARHPRSSPALSGSQLAVGRTLIAAPLRRTCRISAPSVVSAAVQAVPNSSFAMTK